MNEKLVDQIDFSFDVQNHRELTPYVFFTESSLQQETNDSFSNYNNKDYHHQPWMNKIFKGIKTSIYSKKYYGNDQDEKEKYEQNSISKIINTLRSSNPTSIEDHFLHSANVVSNQQSNLQSFVHCLKKMLIRDLRQMAISTQSFPHFKGNDLNNFHALQDINLDDKNITNNEEIEKLQKDEQKMRSIISQTTKDENQDDKKPLNYSIKDLTEFYDILSQYKKAFTFSPSFIISCIQKLDSFLNFLIDPSNKPSQNSNETKNNQNNQKQFIYFINIDSTNLSDEEKKSKLNYFHLILKIKIRLYMMIHKSNEFLCLLMELFILGDDQKSIKAIVDEILPETNRRSKIVKNISSSEILDFCFSNDEKNDFILTKDGIFDVSLKDNNNIDISSLEKVVFEDKDNTKINEALKKCTSSNTKIASSDGILYLICAQDQRIYKTLIHNDEKEQRKEQPPINYPKNDKKRKNKSEKKLQRLKEMRDKKKQRRMERKEMQKPDLNLESSSINIPDFPIVSVGAYNNYIRIIQRKNTSNGKTTFILTNVDLAPNSRMTFDIEEAFSEKSETDLINNQTQFEIEIKDKDGKYKVHDICFSKDYIYFLFEDSTFEQWLIFNKGKVELSKEIISPFIISPQSRLKMDNDEFLYVFEPISKNAENSISINKMHLPSTKYYIRSENEVFLKYPYLQKLSDIVDNCTHLIINRKVTKNITTSEYLEVKNREEDKNGKKRKKVKIIEKNPFEFLVSPTEMSFVVQSITSLTSQISFIKNLIENMKDDDLRKFFIPLFIKMCGVNILYGTGLYYVMKDKIGNTAIERFEMIKNFILSLHSLFDTSNSFESEIIIKESMIITFSLCGKFIFIQDPNNEFHSFINKLLCLNDSNNEYPKFLLRSLSFLVFTYPSLLYIINDELYNQLLKFDQEINLHELLFNSILFIKLETRFSKKIMNIEFIQRISPYLDCLFKYINYLLINESIPLIKTEELFSCFFGIYTSNPIYSLMMQKKLIEISETLYNRIKNIKGVLESDQEFCDKNQDVADMTVSKVTKVFESEHPYDSSSPNPDKIIRENCGFKNNEIVEEIGTVDFESEADAIYLLVDTRSKLQDSDYLSFYIKNDKYNPTNLSTPFHFSFNQLIKYDSNKIRITFTRRKYKSKTVKNPAWGFKLTFYGVKFNNPYCWYANIHLNFYNHFINYLTQIHSNAFKSTDLEDNEKEFNLILEENIIQGIKLEEIDNYEASLNQNKDENIPKNGCKPINRTLTRGISRGINYEQDNDSTYDDQFKKSFIKDLITVDDQSSTLGKKLLDILYTKTSKQNRIRINEATKSILEIEHYLAACLFKQLGLINVCIKFIKNVQINDKYEGIEIPIRLQTLWRNIYSLRKLLVFEYQKSKLPTNSNQSKTKYNFVEYSEEIKRKCKLLLYSDPILKFKEKGNFSNNTIEEATKSIMSFITSKTPISAISELIDKRRKKLSISRQSVVLMNDFIERKLLFKSSKPVFEEAYKSWLLTIQRFNGVTYNELNDFKKLYGSLSYSIIKELFTEPTVPIIINQFFLRQAVFQHEDVESMLKISHVFIDVIEKNKQNQSFIHDRTNILSILILLGIAAKTLNNELTDFILSLLFQEEIDLRSKELILIVIPLLTEVNLENQKISDKSIPFSILFNNKKTPIIIKSVFYWLAYILNIRKISLFNDTKETNTENPYLKMSTEDFFKLVLKGIGQSFIGKSCLFIDDSFDPFTHRQVSEGMIQFIRILVNGKNASAQKVVNEILIDLMNKFKSKLDDVSDDDLYILIGLFVSLSQDLSAIEPERYVSTDLDHDEKKTVIGFDTTLHGVNINDCGFRFTQLFNGFYTNNVLFDPKRFDLNDKHIENILLLNEIIVHSKYFVHEQKYDQLVSDREIGENILIATFYSFLPIIMQNKNNADLLMNTSKVDRSLSLFELTTKMIPTKENSILLLSHYIEQAIHNPFYQHKLKEEIDLVDRNGCFRFMKSMFGEIFYNNESEGNDIIRADPNRKNLFIGSRPFSYSYNSYFEIKINKIGMKRIFIGFINSEDTSIDSAFGFGSVGYDGIFCRRSPFLAEKIVFVGDKIIKKEQKHSDDDDDDSDDDYDEQPNEEEENKDNKNENENENEGESKEENEIRKMLIFSLFNVHKHRRNNKNKSKVDKLLSINEGETLGCYYTPEYCYLVIDKKLTKYRLSHESLNTYIPLIFIDHDDIELEITQNLTRVDFLDEKFNFLNIDNLPSDYFNEKDIKKSIQKEMYSFSNGTIKEKDFLIGQQFLISKIFADEIKSRLETVEAIPKKLLQYREHYGIIKDIQPLNDNTFISKVKLESYNIYTLSKEIIDFDVDSRYLEKIDTNFFNIVENQTKTKFGFNTSFDLNSLPIELQTSSDFNSIRSYLKNKTIKENSKSIAIIMCRYLAFVLVDYLRFSKSNLLQDEGINSKEMNIIINSLSYSIPTITTFKPAFYRYFDQERDNKYLIFQEMESDKEEGLEERLYDKNDFFIPVGFEKLFCRSFILFLKKTEKFISKEFIYKLLHSLYEKAKKNPTVNISNLYNSIQSEFRIESLSPLPNRFIYKRKIDNDTFKMKNVVGFIPILVSSIPCQFPCAKVEDRLLRQSSNEISYFYSTKDCYSITLKWKYNIEVLKKLNINKEKSFDPVHYENYKLQLGFLNLSKYLDEDLLMGPFGFIQVIFTIFQSFGSSNDLYEKHKEMLQGEFINNLFTLASSKNLISLPFLQMIIASLISKIGFPKSLFDGNINNSISIFTDNSNKLVQLVNYPNYKNELPLLFSIYSNLCQTRLLEISTKIENQEKIIELFERYYEINIELFKICNDIISKKESKYIEGEKLKDDDYSNDENVLKKKKNFRSLYLVYYYSILLSNEMNIPYPKFIFVHDRLMQQFGGLRTTISKEDIDEFLTAKNNDHQNTEKVVEYKSKILENDFQLQCSYKLFNIKDQNSSDDDDDDDDFDSLDDDDNENSDEEDNINNENSDEEDNINNENEDFIFDEEEEEEDGDIKYKENTKEKEKYVKSNRYKDKILGKKKHKNDKKINLNIEEKHKVIIHQFKDDSQIELPESGESVVVSFPLEIIILHVKGKNPKKSKLKGGDAFIIDFLPSKQQQKEFFLNNFSEIEKDFEEFITLSKHDNELSEQSFVNNESDQDNQSNNTNENNNIIESIQNNNDNDDNDNDNDNIDDDENKLKFNRNDYKIYEIDRIPMKIDSPSSLSSFTDRVISLRLFTQSTYHKLIEEIMGSYFLNSDDDDDEDESEFENCYTTQIIMPAYSMKTEAKFKFINKVMSNYKTENEKPTLVFNRFEQQKFMEKYKDETKENSNETKDILTSKYRPLFIQFMEQVEEESIPILRVRHDNPFTADLTGENSTDAGGPGRELFSQLIEELMNIHIGVFTLNPNKRHQIKDVNKEDLIPNSYKNTETDDIEMNEEISHLFPRRFIYAGALIACSIVSSLPRPMKLSMMVWEYLTRENVSIENVYEIDKNFQELIESAESLQKQILNDFDSVTNQQFDQVFPHNFVIQDSFDNTIELIPSGSKTRVTKNNLHEFIELAKKVRCDEFKDELKDLKEGFDKIMTYKNIVKILRPQELKLLVCGEPNCNVKLMKTMIEISDVFDDDVDQEKLNQMFWNVMESFSVDERMKFIRFSSGNLSLPAPGMKWEENISVIILQPGKEGKSGKELAYAQTCSSRIDIPFFESEEQLAAILRKSMNYSGLITDSHEEINEVSDFM